MLRLRLRLRLRRMRLWRVARIVRNLVDPLQIADHGVCVHFCKFGQKPSIRAPNDQGYIDSHSLKSM